MMSHAESEYDVLVIGAGPGGYVAAIRAAQLGAQVGLIDKDALGGTCLNRGCIPTKAWVASTKAFETAGKGTEFGFHAAQVTPDFNAMVERNDKVVERLVKGVEYLMRKNNIDVLNGEASFVGPHTLSVGSDEGPRELKARHIIVATGSQSLLFPAFGYDGERVITSTEALRLKQVPKRLVIIGGGVIGCEFASIFRILGADVTVVEALPQILPMVEKDVARQLQSYFKRKGVKVHTKTKVLGVDKSDRELTVLLDGQEDVAADIVLVAVGRKANTEGLNLEAAGIETNRRGEIPVNDRMATQIEGIWALGDVIDGPYKLAHVASRQGIVAAGNIMGHPDRMDYAAVPNVIFSSPEVATVGMTTEAAQDTGAEVVTAKFSFMGSGKAIAAGETEGFVKIVADKASDRILGAHIIGPEATTLISEVTLAVQWKLTVEQLTKTIHAHPTLPEAVMEAAEGIHGMTIHG